MDPPNRYGGMDLAPTAMRRSSTICPRNTAAPRNAVVPHGRWLQPLNTPDLASRSPSSDRPSISDTVNLGTGLMDIGSSTRSSTTNPFGHWPQAPNAPDPISQSRNVDLPSMFHTGNLAHGRTAIGNITRPTPTAVPFSHWLHPPDTPGVVSEPQNLDEPSQSFIDSLPPRLRNRYADRHARDRTHAENGQTTANAPNNLGLVSQSRDPDRPAQSFTDTIPPSLRDRYVSRHAENLRSNVSGPNPPDLVSQSQNLDRSTQSFMESWRGRYGQLQARDRPHAGNGQTSVNGSHTYQNPYMHQTPYTQPADRNSTIASATRHMKAETFLESLPVLSLADLAKDSRECLICLDPYQTSPHKSVPVRLPCGHVIGKDCLLQWLKSSPENHNNNACPICRSILVDRDVRSLGDRIQAVRDFMTEHEVMGDDEAIRLDTPVELRARAYAVNDTGGLLGPRGSHDWELPGPSVPDDMEGIVRRARTRREYLGDILRRANDADDGLIDMLEREGHTARAQELRARRAQRQRF